MAASMEEREKLLRAVEGGEVDEVRRLLRQGVNVNANKSSLRQSIQPVSNRAQDRDIDLLKSRVIQLRNNVNLLTLNQQLLTDLENVGYQLQQSRAKVHRPIKTIAHVIEGSFRERELLKLLFEPGADPNKISRLFGQDVLEYRISRGKLEAVPVLSERGADPNQVSRLFGQNVLEFAISRGKLETVQVLLERGADPNQVFRRLGLRALEYTVVTGNREMVQLLIEHGADPNKWLNNSPLHWSIRRDDVKMVELLLDNGAKVDDKVTRLLETSVLEYAVSIGNLKMVQLLLEQGADPNKWLIDSPLHLSIERGDVKMVELLLDNGAKQDDEKSGATSLHVASAHGRIDVVKLLLNNGAQVSAIDKRGRTAIDVVVEGCNMDDAREKELKNVLENKWEEEKREVDAEVASILDKAARVHSPGSDLMKVSLTLSRELRNGDPVLEWTMRPVGQGQQLDEKKTSIAFHESVVNSSAAVVNISCGNWTASSFFVGKGKPKYLLTNYHVIEREVAAEKPGGQILKLNAMFYFDHPNAKCLQIQLFCKVLLFDEVLDVALLELDETSIAKASKRQKLPDGITRFCALGDIQTTVHLVGHPGGEFKVAEIKRKVVSQKEVRATLPSLKHFRGKTTLTDPRRVVYNINTEFGPGSSGSPVFVCTQDHKAALVAIHTSAFPLINSTPHSCANVGPSSSEAVEEHTWGQGLRIEVLYDWLSTKDRSLCDEIFPDGRPRNENTEMSEDVDSTNGN